MCVCLFLFFWKIVYDKLTTKATFEKTDELTQKNLND